MIVKILPNTLTNITLTYASKSYLCYAPVAAMGSTFKLGSATITPTTTDESTFVHEVEVSLNDQNTCVVDDAGNVYVQVFFYKENLGLTEPARV